MPGRDDLTSPSVAAKAHARHFLDLTVSVAPYTPCLYTLRAKKARSTRGRENERERRRGDAPVQRELLLVAGLDRTALWQAVYTYNQHGQRVPGERWARWCRPGGTTRRRRLAGRVCAPLDDVYRPFKPSVGRSTPPEAVSAQCEACSSRQPPHAWTQSGLVASGWGGARDRVE